MKRNIRLAVRYTAGVLIALSLAGANGAYAADYPAAGRTIKILVGFSPGGINDLMSRIFAEGLSQRLGVPVVVENKPGANGEIALAEAARAAPDGYTLIATTSALAATPITSASFKYDVVDGYTHLGIIAQTPYILAANGTMPFNDVRGMIAYAKANPGKLNFGAPVESTNLDFALLWQLAGITVTSIPYKGTAPATAATLANEVQLTAVSHRAISPHLESGKLKALGFASNKRFSLVPQIPTIAEAVKGYEATTLWVGFSGPKGIPLPIVTRLNSEFAAILKQPAVRSQIVEKFAFEIVGSTPDEMTADLRAARNRYNEAVRITGFKPQ